MKNNIILINKLKCKLTCWKVTMGCSKITESITKCFCVFMLKNERQKGKFSEKTKTSTMDSEWD